MRRLWGMPDTRKALLASLSDRGYGAAELGEIKTMIHSPDRDLCDVIAYISFALAPFTRKERADSIRTPTSAYFHHNPTPFIAIVLPPVVVHASVL